MTETTTPTPTETPAEILTETEADDVLDFNLWDEFETSKDAEENGVWYEVLPNISFKLRRFQSKIAMKNRALLEKPYNKITDAGKPLPETVADVLITKQMAQSSVVDWCGVKDKNKNDMPHSVENVETVMTALPHLRDRLINFVLKMENFKEEETAQAEKN